MISLGVPMIAMGDEVRRTQRGNNNAYCQDNEISWFDWTLLSKHADVHRFWKVLVAHRLQWNNKHEAHRLNLNQLLRRSKYAWHGVKLDRPDWSHGSRSVALHLELPWQDVRCHLIFNAYWEALQFELPEPGEGQVWRRWIDTALDPPDDISEWSAAPPVPGQTYLTRDRSVVALIAGTGLGTAFEH
jgi:isoamylase